LKDADLDRAAEIITQLNALDNGLPVAKVIGKGETFESLLPTFAYLSFHQWIGASDGWKRIWLLTEKKEILACDGLSSLLRR